MIVESGNIGYIERCFLMLPDVLVESGYFEICFLNFPDVLVVSGYLKFPYVLVQSGHIWSFFLKLINVIKFSCVLVCSSCVECCFELVESEMLLVLADTSYNMESFFRRFHGVLVDSACVECSFLIFLYLLANLGCME